MVTSHNSNLEAGMSGLGVNHVIPAIARVRSPQSGHSANARVCEYTARGAVENKSFEIKTLRPPRVPRC